MSSQSQSLFHQLWQDIRSINLLNFCLFWITVHYSLLFLISQLKHAKFKFPPSPPKLPIVGHLLKLITNENRPRHHTLSSLASKHGPLMLLQLGEVRTLVVSSAEFVKEIMTAHDVVFGNKPVLRAVEVLFYGFCGVGYAQFGEYWKCVRKVCDFELLGDRMVRFFEGVREVEVLGLVERVKGNGDGNVVDLRGLFEVFSRGVVEKSVIGGGFVGFEELARRVRLVRGKFWFRDYFPSLDWVDDVRKFTGRLMKVFDDVDRFLDDVVEDHYVRMLDGDDVKDLTDVLLRIHKEGKMEVELSQDNLKAILLDMLTAGTDAITATLEWTMAELMKNPSALKQAQEEVRRVVGNKEKVDENDVNRMEYLKCAIKETLRLHPPRCLLTRETSGRVKLGGYDILSKTRVLINVWAIHRDLKVWDDANEFLPRRFLDEPFDFKDSELGYLPFGDGCRVCPGISYALAAVELVLANLLYWFDWKLPEEITPESLDMSETCGETVFKKMPLQLIPMLHYS